MVVKCRSNGGVVQHYRDRRLFALSPPNPEIPVVAIPVHPVMRECAVRRLHAAGGRTFPDSARPVRVCRRIISDLQTWGKTGHFQICEPVVPAFGVRPCRGNVVIAAVRILKTVHRQLFQIALTGTQARLLPRAVQRRKKHTGQNRNDRNHDKKFNQSKFFHPLSIVFTHWMTSLLWGCILFVPLEFEFAVPSGRRSAAPSSAGRLPPPASGTENRTFPILPVCS